MGLRPLELDITRNLEKIGDVSREDLNPVNTSVMDKSAGILNTRRKAGSKDCT